MPITKDIQKDAAGAAFVIDVQGAGEAVQSIDEDESYSLHVTSSGVNLQGVDFVTTPLVVEVRGKSMSGELQLGSRVFRGPQPLDELAARMERWFRFAFHDFLPASRSVAHWKPPDRAALLRAWGTVPCPECGTKVQPRVGEVCQALDTPADDAGL